MPLLKVQQVLAAILMQPDERNAFAADPKGTLRALGLKGKDLDLVASLDAGDLTYFATRRNIDRHQALRADAPLTVTLLEATRGRVQAYFRAFPFSLEDPRDETERFAAWCGKAAKDGTVPALAPDLARYEAAVLRLLAQKAPVSKPSAKPKRAQGQVRFTAAHRLHEALRSTGVPTATAGETYVVVQLVDDDVKWHVITALENALMASADGKHDEAAWLSAAAKRIGAGLPEARKAAAGLRRDGLIAQARKTAK